MSINPTSYEQACLRIIRWSKNNASKVVCFANVHMTMTAFDQPVFRAMINQADLVTPDGMPLVWTLWSMGYKNQKRVYGPTLTTKLLPLLADEGVPIGFFGSTTEVLKKLQSKIQQQHPEIDIVYANSPPFRELTEEEDQQIVAEIKSSGARVLFVGLGCPKQEIWMYHHKDQVQAVLLGVGAAFDFIAGTKKQAPLWIQRLGMEWFFRLVTEPKRLWKRYLIGIPLFLWRVLKQRLGGLNLKG